MSSLEFLPDGMFVKDDARTISVEAFNDTWSDVVYGELNLIVCHDEIEVSREARYHLEAAGSDIDDNREVYDGCDYDADCNITKINICISDSYTLPIRLTEEDVRLIACAICKAACDKAEEGDNNQPDYSGE